MFKVDSKSLKSFYQLNVGDPVIIAEFNKDSEGDITHIHTIRTTFNYIVRGGNGYIMSEECCIECNDIINHQVRLMLPVSELDNARIQLTDTKVIYSDPSAYMLDWTKQINHEV